MLKEMQTAKVGEEGKGGHSKGRAQWWRRILFIKIINQSTRRYFLRGYIDRGLE